jgi:hypothetical protein
MHIGSMLRSSVGPKRRGGRPPWDDARLCESPLPSCCSSTACRHISNPALISAHHPWPSCCAAPTAWQRSTAQAPKLREPPRGGGPLARQRATRSFRDERRLQCSRSPGRSPSRRSFAVPPPYWRSARDERGSARGRGPPSRGRSHCRTGACWQPRPAAARAEPLPNGRMLAATARRREGGATAERAHAGRHGRRCEGRSHGRRREGGATAAAARAEPRPPRPPRRRRAASSPRSAPAHRRQRRLIAARSRCTALAARPGPPPPSAPPRAGPR